MSDRGFTLVELLVAALLTLVVLAIAFGVVGPARASFDRDAAGSDVAQRLRVGLQALADDVRGAGAGAALAGHIRLPDSVPVVEPLASLDGTEASDGNLHALRIVTISATAAQSRLREPVTAATGPIRLRPPPICSSASAVCGFDAGATVMIFDETATYDLVDIHAIDSFDLSLVPASPLVGRYRADATLAAADIVTYGLAPEEAGGQRLVKVTAAGAAMPLLDHVVEFAVSVYGTAVPPALAVEGRPPAYGPRPPPLGEDDDRDPWGAGENCTIALGEDGRRVARLPELGTEGQLVPLTPDMLRDGPWCPGDGSPRRFDADLLRIRRVDLRVRVEVASAMLRGPAGALFRRAGQGGRASAWVPDGELRLSIVPRNLAR